MRVLSGKVGSRCDFCQRSATESSPVVAAKSVAICRSCAVLATLAPGEAVGVATLLADALTHHATSFEADVRVLLARVLGSLAMPSDTWYVVVDSLTASGYGAATFYVLDQIPRSSWRPNDWLNYTWGASAVGRFDDAVSASNDIPWDSITDPGNRHILNANVSWARCHSNTPPSDQELEQLLAELSAARQYWSKLLEGPRATQANARLSALEGVAAKCNLLRGRTDAAIDCLECAAATSAGASPLALILWGDILSQRGDPTNAREKWRLAAKSEDARNPGVLPLLLAERLTSDDKIAD